MEHVIQPNINKLNQQLFLLLDQDASVVGGQLSTVQAKMSLYCLDILNES